MLSKNFNFLGKISESKYLAVILLTLVLIGGSFLGIWTISKSQKSSLISDLSVKAAFLGEAIADRSKVNILLSDNQGLSKIYDEVKLSSDSLIEISFYDAQKELLWAHPQSFSEGFLREKYLNQIVESDSKLTVNFTLRDNSNQILGYLHFICSTKEIDDIISTLQLRVALITLILILTLLLISIWSTNRVTRINHSQTLSLARMELAEKNNSLQKKFMSTMSHELRTPLNAISGFSNILRNQIQSKEGQNYLKIIIESANAMEYLVNDILDYSKITQDQLKFRAVDFCFNSILTQTVKICRGKLKQEVKFQFDPPQGILPVIGDVNRVRQVLINLISNAIKFTSSGYVKISHRHTSEGENHILYFEVEDSGIGIADDKKDFLFKAFMQAHHPEDHDIESTGLGLSICKRLVEKMGGRIGFASELNVGSTFYFEISLPKGNADKCLNNKSKINIENYEIEGKVLIVEDVRINQLLLEKMLDKWDISYDVVSNGEEAVKIVDKDFYDLILMDIEMPVMDGLEAMRAIKAKIPKLPIIACTANASKENESLYLKEGMDGFIGKPIKTEALMNEISRFLNIKKTKSIKSSIDLVAK